MVHKGFELNFPELFNVFIFLNAGKLKLHFLVFKLTFPLI